MGRLKIRVHENAGDVFNPPPQISKTWSWWSEALEVLKGERDGDKEKALAILTYWRGYFTVTLKRSGHYYPFVVNIGKCGDEEEAILKAKKQADKKGVYDIDDSVAPSVERTLYDAGELPAEYHKYAPKD